MDAEQQRDFININRAFIIPVLRKVYAFIVKNSEADNSTKEQLYSEINQIEPEFDKPAGISVVDDNHNTWFIYLDDCSRDHDFKTQLDKIKFRETSTYDDQGKLVTTTFVQKMHQLMNNIFGMYKAVFLLYNTFSIKNEDLVEKISELYNFDLDVDKLQFNDSKWLLFINESWIDSIGLFVKQV